MYGIEIWNAKCYQLKDNPSETEETTRAQQICVDALMISASYQNDPGTVGGKSLQIPK